MISLGFLKLKGSKADKQLKEFGRAVKPGGIVRVTTRAKKHLENSAKIAGRSDLPRHLRHYARMFDDFQAAIDSYDRGEFVYSPLGGGRELSKEFYGEAVIPHTYVEKNWTADFDLVDFVDGYSQLAQQPVIVLRHR